MLLGRSVKSHSADNVRARRQSPRREHPSNPNAPPLYSGGSRHIRDDGQAHTRGVNLAEVLRIVKHGTELTWLEGAGCRRENEKHPENG